MNHIHIWQVSPQLSCGDTCQIWMRYSLSNWYFDNILRLEKIKEMLEIGSEAPTSGIIIWCLFFSPVNWYVSGVQTNYIFLVQQSAKSAYEYGLNCTTYFLVHKVPINLPLRPCCPSGHHWYHSTCTLSSRDVTATHLNTGDWKSSGAQSSSEPQ